MEARDAIVTWLEQGSNFLRVTTSTPFSPSAQRGRAPARDVQAEDAVLDELAAFVNRSLPRTHWDGRHARQMLKHYLHEFRATAEAAASPQFALDARDRLSGFQTVRDKLDSMCRHFHRLQTLHARARERDKRPQTYVKLAFALSDAQRREREKDVVPESDFSNLCDNSEADRKDQEHSSESTVTEMDVPTDKELQLEAAKELTELAHGEKEATAAKRTDGGEQKLQEKNNAVVPVPSLVTLTSDEDEEDALPALKRSTRARKREAPSPAKSRGEGDSPSKKKLRRVKSAEHLDVSDVTPTQTTQTASSDEPQDSPLNDENVLNINTHHADKKSPRQKGNYVRKVAPASKSAQTSTSTSNQAQPEVNKPAARRDRAPKNAVPPQSTEGKKSIQGSVPDALRSAIAEVVLQRQQLLSRRVDAESQSQSQEPQTQERFICDSDIELSDVTLLLPEPKSSAPHKKQRSSTPSNTPRHGQRTMVSSGPPAGLLPPLIDGPRIVCGQSNLEQKRVFFKAKQLAFEQLKWHHENELQHYELELLRREMEARESLARQELQLKKMRIRADIIQPMISAGASVADIAERLRLL